MQASERMLPLKIRRARPGEQALLTELAVRAKAHWPYTPAQINAWRADLTVSADEIAGKQVHVAEVGNVIAGFFALSTNPSGWALEHLWVDPAAIGQGIGTALLAFAARLAADGGGGGLMIDADPNAEAFYIARGAVRVSAVPAPIDGDASRERPQMWLRCGCIDPDPSASRELP